jgi:hypothetical protein
MNSQLDTLSNVSKLTRSIKKIQGRTHYIRKICLEFIFINLHTYYVQE